MANGKKIFGGLLGGAEGAMKGRKKTMEEQEEAATKVMPEPEEAEEVVAPRRTNGNGTRRKNNWPY